MKVTGKKRAVILSSGEIGVLNFYKKIIRRNDKIICADGGLRFAKKLGLKPDVLIGDFDSLKKSELSGLNKTKTKILSFPKEKDKTDTQLAVEYAISSGVGEIIMLGSLGGRIDHLLSNIHLLRLGVKKSITIKILDEFNEIRIIDKALNFRTRKGETLSLLPLTEKVKGIYTEGLKYPLKNGTMVLGNPYGVSNETISSKVKIKIRSGLLLLIRNLE